MAKLQFFGGVEGEIGGNKILVEEKGTKIFLDFGQPFNFGVEYFTGWLSPRAVNGLGDHFEFGLLPRIRGLYAKDQLTRTDLPYCEPEIAAVFLSHGHFDHVAYLDFLGAARRIYEGKLYSWGMAGIIYCYDLKDGTILWTYAASDYYHEVLWSNNWPVDGDIFASGGKLYFFECEHSVNQPIPRGSPVYCLNATTGDVIWRVDGLFRTTHWGGSPIMGDSVIAMYSTLDQQVWAAGQGPSATTVQAPLTAITAGDSVVIQGTVIDVSPGTKQTALTLRFPNGVPAVSDDSQGDWMKYVYGQFPRPANAKGVEVSIDAVDPNSNWVHIGTATSDTSGLFTYEWNTPDIPGKYTIIATFAGSGAYYASYAETGMAISEAPASPTPTPAAVLPPDTTMTIIGTGIAIIIAVAIATILLLRKRP